MRLYANTATGEATLDQCKNDADHPPGGEVSLMSNQLEAVPTTDATQDQVPAGTRAVIVGGGIAGIAAATVLTERGVSVRLLERDSQLGGRAGAWTETLGDGQRFEMERGFHAFFRQYYNLRALLRRVDPDLDHLAPVKDYPILGASGAVESFAKLVRRSPFNVIQLTSRTTYMRFRDLFRVNAPAALEMFRYDSERTYAKYDDKSASDYLSSLNFPDKARSMLFNVFSHSFFNREEEMSAAELLMMFHFYFTRNPEGLIFDVAQKPFSTAYWRPFAQYLEERGASVRCDCEAYGLRRQQDRWIVDSSAGELVADMVVLAVTVPALKALVDASPELHEESWLQSIHSLELTRPFAVWRLWLNQPTAEERAPFAGVTEYECLHNISLYHLFEDESREWAQKSGGSVVELHAYAVDPMLSATDIKGSMLDGLHELYPETRAAEILEERFLLDQDCPSFAPGSHSHRPTVETPFSGLCLAGDSVKLPIPSALMERAAASGMMAANHLLAPLGVTPEPIATVPRRGLIAGRATRPRA
ncbi:MAG: FAD-dependent oxidoreductase [Polyangiales bacterium]